MPILNLYKPMSLTPLQVIENYKKEHPECADVPFVYAGRLDPMATGVLIVLTGEDRHSLPAYLLSTKTYEATILFGFASDTFDVLGRVTETDVPVDLDGAREALLGLKGIQTLPLPPYSAYKVKGKPLHWWAKQGRLEEIEIPMRDMEVLGVQDISFENITASDALESLVDRVELVTGDFRQAETIDDWKKILENKKEPLLTATVTLSVTSGTYIRSIAHALGKYLGCGALLYNLHRTRVGECGVGESETI